MYENNGNCELGAEALMTKIPIRFNKEGKIRIYMMSDIQETLETIGEDKRTLAGIRAVMDNVKPDLVILGGDNCNGVKLKTREELDEYLKIIAAPMEEREIPWMHVFGNHDHDIDVPAREQQAMYEAFDHCISKHISEDIPGASNYMIPIRDYASEKIKYCIYAFDTHHKNPVFRENIGVKELLLPNTMQCVRKWDIVRFEQLMWYWNTSKALEKREGKPVKAMAVMHVIPYEYLRAMYNAVETSLVGEHDEVLQLGVLNSGLFAAMLERGDVNLIAAGHSHKVTADATYCGIRMCLDSCAGFSPYGIDERRGGRVFDITSDGSINSFMVSYAQYIDISK